MSHVAEKPTAFSSALDRRPQGGPRWLDDLRSRGAAKFASLGIPTVRDEEWRFTNASALGTIDFVPAGAISGAAERLNGFPYTDAPVRLVIVNGRFDTTLSRMKGLPSGVHAGSLAVALRDHADVVQRYFGQLADFTSRSFAALNTAFVQDGAFIHLAEGAVVDTPIHVIFVSGADGSTVMAHPRTLIVAGANAEAKIIESYVGTSGEMYFTNAVSEISSAIMPGSITTRCSGNRSTRSTSRAFTRTRRAARGSRRTRSRLAGSSCAMTPSRSWTGKGATARSTVSTCRTATA